MKNENQLLKLISAFVLVIFLSFSGIFAQVKVYEGQETIPTYKIGKEEVSPIFYTGRGVQGAEGHIYPYASQEDLGDKVLTDVTYDMVYLENEFVRVKILPAFGGRLFSAIDKTNGHELFHTNSVIKPDLIGTLGAWVSGGIEWCFPHHHRTTTMMPSDYRMIENEDGSATVWVGETEKTMGMRGVIGITLRPGRSFIETDYRINNTNTKTKKFLFWANVAITANDDFRTFWPPSQEIGVFHNNSSFTEWPISHQVYKGVDYTKGVDLTWWKNHPDPVSFFFWDGKDGFLGGYDYGKNAGTVHVGDPLQNKTSKLWQFGPGLQGQNARRKLTDDGKAYVELMTGTFSNNQPDYSWIAPHSVKDAKNYWYPLRDLEIVKNSTVDASVTLQMRNPKTIFYGFNTTKTYKNARMVLKYNDEVLAEKTMDIAPAHPFTETYKGKTAFDEYKLYIELSDADGKKLVSYAPQKPTHPELPEPQESVKKAKELESVEELYLTGRFVDQFNRPGLDPDDYYLKALKISPDDYRVNLAMGIRKTDQLKYEEALGYLQNAADKLKIKYYQPKEGEIYYYMGLAQRALGKTDEAYRNFGRSTWYYQWYSAGNYQLAQMESNKGNFEKALEYCANAYSTNTRDGRIVVLYSALLRKSGETDKAIALIDELLAYDPINFSALYEKELLQGNRSIEKWHKNMQDVDNNYLEIAVNYINAGLSEDGIDLLSPLEKSSNPLINYYRSYFYNQIGDAAKAREMLKLAQNASLDYIFPYREETERVLQNAIELDPQNAKAYYLLGNLLFDNRPEDANKAWEQVASINNTIPMVYRNLAFGAFHHGNDADGAIAYMKKAISLRNDVPRWYAELATYYDASDADFRECLDILRKNVTMVKKDVSAPKTLVQLYNLNGEYDEAISLLETHHFRTWEGGRSIYWHYVDAHTLKARQLINAGKNKEAVAQLEKALLYPENLEVGKASDDEKNAMIYYYMGLAYENMGDKKKSKASYEKSATAENRRGMHDLEYFKAKSNQQLGNTIKANEMFKNLIRQGKEQREKGTDNSLIAVEEGASGNNKAISNSYYLEALGNKGLGNSSEAQKLFETALDTYKNNLWAQVMVTN
ncbi:tetratricopeptide repeat protein [Kriegella aquimaris]|uniref:TPR repeat-containing protein n=1 Tax=Kriegella aquimaris TaxID=192904 RepID=A0A1G9S2A7_9FLAO|nr:DUF5107 domain-containing protein [Kriegella aquimaris]SDM29544.1 TPR repeat-containing protein [Kriegella aquimaris]